MESHDHESCRRLLASLDALGTEDVEEVERIIAEHLETCAVCMEEEGRLAALVAGYSRTELSLPPDLEARLLDSLCPPVERPVSRD
jgi:hypothetical protein